jgi:hypothetical protein
MAYPRRLSEREPGIRRRIVFILRLWQAHAAKRHATVPRQRRHATRHSKGSVRGGGRAKDEARQAAACPPAELEPSVAASARCKAPAKHPMKIGPAIFR